MPATPPARQTILHLDMDAFFAAVEVRDHPELRGRPVVVGAPPDRRGVVSTASYEARAFGIRSAMPSRTAFTLCPQAVFLPVRMERYAAVSEQIMQILQRFTPVLEPVSIDEAFLDVAGVSRRWPDPVALATELKRAIRAGTGLTASVGLAVNKFLAKVASDLHKPDGLTIVPPDRDGILAFLRPLPVTRIWGVGRVTAATLEGAGLRTIGQLQGMTDTALVPLLGPSLARHVLALARGEDSRSVGGPETEKSISNEVTFEQDCPDPVRQEQTLLELAEQVGGRLRAAGHLARTAHVKVRFADFRTLTRQVPLRPPTDRDRDLIRAALAILTRERIRTPVRLLGFGVSGWVQDGGEPATVHQPLLLPEADEAPCPPDHPRAALDRAVDDIRRRFGHDSLRRGRWERNDHRDPAP